MWKILFYATFLVIIFSCKRHDENYNNTFLVKDGDGQILFKAPYYSKSANDKSFYTKNDTVFFKVVYTLNNSELPLKDVIDINTFVLIPNTEAEKKKINNIYYQNNLFYNYFKDKNYVYIYDDNSSKPRFFQVGSSSNYNLLGGAYLKINNKIYWRGLEVVKADINSFKVMNVQKNKSEWEASIGIDQNYLYSGNIIMTLKQFNENYLWEENQKKNY